MDEFLSMGWPAAVFLVACVIALVVLYGLRQAAKAEERRDSRIVEGTHRQVIPTTEHPKQRNR